MASPTLHTAPTGHDIGDLTVAFHTLTRSSQQLEEAYRRLVARVQQVDRELVETNERLERKVDELDSLSRYLNDILGAMDSGVVAIDAEGSFLYLVVPVTPPRPDLETLLRLLHDYKVVIVRGGGVWAVGHQSLSEVLHHPASVREICLYRIGVWERGIDPRTLEPEKARRW